MSRGAVELIWCASLAHFLFFYRLIQGKDFTEHREIDPHSDPDVDKALQLLHWALKNTLKPEEATEWPRRLPTGSGRAPRSRLRSGLGGILCASLLAELCCTMNWHISLWATLEPRMMAGTLSRKQTLTTLLFDWLLGKVDMDSNEFKGRILGLVQATVLTTALKMYGKKLAEEPLIHFLTIRISSVVNRFKTDDRHTAKDMAYAILELHFVNSKRTWNSGSFKNSGEALEALCNRLAEEAHGRIDRDGKKL